MTKLSTNSGLTYTIKKLTFLKVQFSEIKKFIPRPFFEDLQLTQISINFKTCCALKIRSGSETFLERRILCFSSYKNCKLKLKQWWVGPHKRKRRTFFVLLILTKGKFFNICILSQCIVYWINFQNIHTCTYIKKHYFIHFLLVLKLLKAFSVSLIWF